MVDVAPFRALRYDPKVAGDPAATSAPAYDDLERFAYAQHRTASPYTVLELLASSPGPGSYGAARATFDRWCRTGVLFHEPDPGFYLYEEHELRHGIPAVQRGLLAAVRVGDRRVLTHEATDPLRVADRVARLAAVPADLAPVFGMYADAPATLAADLRQRPSEPPVVALTDERGSDHRVWALRDPGRLAAIQLALRDVNVVIADGHHRWAAAAAVRRTRAGADRVLFYLVDAHRDGPQLLGVHRLVPALTDEAERRLAVDFAILEVDAEVDGLAARMTALGGRVFGLRLAGGRALLLRARDDRALSQRLPEARPPVWRDLDTAVLHGAVLPDLGDPVVEYRSDARAAAAELDARGRGGLFLLRPVSPAQVFACAAAGAAMPAKTTWFRPKPRAGLVMRRLTPERRERVDIAAQALPDDEDET